MTKHERHPLSAAFPDMKPEELATLNESILCLGVQEPITLFEGKVLDGWHRYGIALSLGIPCPEKQFKGNYAAAEEFAWAHNGARRHLARGELALARAKMRQLREEREGAPGALSTLKEDAKELGVSERTMKQAVRVVRQAAPAVVKAVEKGTLSLKEADKLTTLPPDAQESVARAPKPPPARKRSNTEGSMATGRDRTNEAPSTGTTWKPAKPPRPEVGASKEAVAELHEKLEVLTAENDRLTDENMALKQLVGDEAMLQEVEAHIGTLRAEMERAQRELVTMTESRDHYMREARELLSQCNIYRGQLAKHK